MADYLNYLQVILPMVSRNRLEFVKCLGIICIFIGDAIYCNDLEHRFR